MSIDYAAIAKSAKASLADAGQLVTRRAGTAGAYDPATGTAGVTVSDSQRTAVVLDFGAGQTMVRGVQIKGGDKRLLLEATGSAPDLTDRYVIGGNEYTVVSIGETNPAGVPVLYDLHLTR